LKQSENKNPESPSSQIIIRVQFNTNVSFANKTTTEKHIIKGASKKKLIEVFS